MKLIDKILVIFFFSFGYVCGSKVKANDRSSSNLAPIPPGQGVLQNRSATDTSSNNQSQTVLAANEKNSNTAPNGSSGDSRAAAMPPSSNHEVGSIRTNSTNPTGTVSNRIGQPGQPNGSGADDPSVQNGDVLEDYNNASDDTTHSLPKIAICPPHTPDPSKSSKVNANKHASVATPDVPVNKPHQTNQNHPADGSEQDLDPKKKRGFLDAKIHFVDKRLHQGTKNIKSKLLSLKNKVFNQNKPTFKPESSTIILKPVDEVDSITQPMDPITLLENLDRLVGSLQQVSALKDLNENLLNEIETYIKQVEPVKQVRKCPIPDHLSDIKAALDLKVEELNQELDRIDSIIEE